MPTPPYHPAITGPDSGPPLIAVLLAIAVAFVIAAMLVRIIVDWAMTLRNIQRQPRSIVVLELPEPVSCCDLSTGHDGPCVWECAGCGGLDDHPGCNCAAGGDYR